MKSTLFLSLAASAAAMPALEAHSGVYYAFYDNYECSGDPITKTHFNSGNGGCFDIRGAKCAQEVGGLGQLDIPVLEAFSTGGCNAGDEAGCNSISQLEYDGAPLKFNSAKWGFADNALSFQFHQGSAGKSAQCPSACAGECPGGHPPKEKRGDKPKNHDYAWYDSDDCSGEHGTSIEPNISAGCQIEGDRGSVYNHNDAEVVLAGFRTQDQSCPLPNRFNTITLPGNSCTKVTRFSDGGPNSYLQTGFGNP